MTGRDYRQFVKLHRESTIKNDDVTKVLSKIADTNLVKYKQVKYELLKDFIDERKVAAESSLEKVKKLEECSKAKREELFIKQHKFLWFKEFTKLNSFAKKYQQDLEDYLKLIQTKSNIEYADIFIDQDNFDDDFENSLMKDTDEIKFINEYSHIKDLDEYQDKLNQELNTFQKCTLEPIYNLNEDLKYYLTVNPLKTIKNNREKNSEILETIEQVKNQQGKLLDSLQQTYLELIDEIENRYEELEEDELTVVEGIPYEAFLLESPDEELKLSVLNEFIIIDFKYKEKLEQLNENHKALMTSKSSYDGWNRYEHENFQHIYEQYQYHNVNLTNCNFTLRDLMFDRMKRTFEIYNIKTNRNELVKHEEWINMRKYYQHQKKLLYNEWNESRKGLLIKAEATFNEAFEMIEHQREKKLEREKQLKICNELYAKVKKFREQKLEALEIQQKLDMIMEEDRIKKMKIENEKEKKKREEQKRNINQYHERLEAERLYFENKEKEKLNNLKVQLEKQSIIDCERIEYRRKLIEEKIANNEEKKNTEKLQNELKEKRVEKFLESVKPNVDKNPARLMSFTLSELSRRGVNIGDKNDESISNDKYSEKKKLYNVFSFTDNQLNNDARLRIEARLRQAGLINNDYAREIIKHVAPPTVPRKDTVSNIHYNFNNLN